jgi:hypothetical protein
MLTSRDQLDAPAVRIAAKHRRGLNGGADFSDRATTPIRRRSSPSFLWQFGRRQVLNGGEPTNGIY